MFNSTVLEVAIGMISCYCAVSLIVSSINEGVSSMLQLRGKYLLQGIQKLLNDPDFNHMAQAVYNNAQFHPAGDGQAVNAKDLESLPSYASPRQFATALTDTLTTLQTLPGDMGSAIQNIPNPQLRQALSSMYERAGNDLSQFEAEVAYWFDQSMQRLAGAYKRTIQVWTVVFGLVLAMVFNIDTFHLFKVLWLHPTLAANISADQFANAQVAMDQLSVTSLPIGWEKPPFSWGADGPHWNYGLSDFLLMALGWGVTVLTTLFGAPFWFDLLQKATHLRGAGNKPASTPNTAS